MDHPFADRIWDPEEEAIIHAMMRRVPLLVASVHIGPVGDLADRLHRHAGKHHANVEEFHSAVFDAVNDLRDNMGSVEQEKNLQASCHGDAMYVRDLRLYSGVLHGVQQVVFTHIFDSFARLELGDPTPKDASQNLAEALYGVPGLGKHTADQIVRNLETQVDRSMAECMGSRGR